jgi:hypothetical protein
MLEKEAFKKKLLLKKQNLKLRQNQHLSLLLVL